MPRHKPKPRKNVYVEQGHGNVFGDFRTTPPPIILAGNLSEHKKRAASRARILEEQKHDSMESVIGHYTDPEELLPKWLKGANGSKERR